MTDPYYIKAGYRANLQQATFDTEGAEAYWNADRRLGAQKFQYYVYAYARHWLASRRAPAAVMDVGCGYPWKFARLLAPYATSAVLVDQPTTRDLARTLCPSAKFVAVDLETITAGLGESFDLVVCADVIEHLVDPDRCLAFIRRHLRSTGLAVFSTPERDNLRGPTCDHCPKREHVREWNAPEFVRLLTSRGFRVEAQRFYPQQRVSSLEYALSRLLGFRTWPRRWGGCQMIAACAVNPATPDSTISPSETASKSGVR